MEEKLTFNENIREKFLKALAEQNFSEVRRLYEGIMSPVKKSDYSDESLYLEDLEWDLYAKKSLLDFLLSEVSMETLLICLK